MYFLVCLIKLFLSCSNKTVYFQYIWKYPPNHVVCWIRDQRCCSHARIWISILFATKNCMATSTSVSKTCLVSQQNGASRNLRSVLRYSTSSVDSKKKRFFFLFAPLRGENIWFPCCGALYNCLRKSIVSFRLCFCFFFYTVFKRPP